MAEIKIFKKINAIRPVMIAGWPGMGSVALGVVDYLKRALDATRFAEIKLDRFTALEGIVVEDGLAKMPEPPKNSFYYAKDHNIVIFEGEAQLHGHEALDLLNKTLDVASELKVPRIYTGAAFPVPVGHKDAADIYAVANSEFLKDTIAKSGMRLLEGGHISGLNGLLLGFARERNVEAICLLATIPQYAISIPNPKASLAIMNVLKAALNFDIDLLEINNFIREMDEKMSAIEEKVKDVFPMDGGSHKAPPTEKKVPGYVMERIEKLFEEAKLDKKKANELKQELDRWDLYKAYEDRFLDLFKDNNQ
jgi:proteasome assembly chaperone (PAC2) family protein